MDTKNIIYFRTMKSAADETYLVENRQYLCCSIWHSNLPLVGRSPLHLLVPDDNSILANSIRNNPNNSRDIFIIPFTDLKFQSNFFKNIFAAQDIILVKNTDQVKKITQKEFSSSQTITFKVLGQKKTRKEEFGIGSYHHELEIEPFSLGIEGLPEISRIAFVFGYAQSLENSLTSLIKTKLYNSKLLAKSVGKTFTMKVKEWNIKEFDNSESLLFTETSDFDLDSFQEKNNENGNSPTSPNQPKNNDNSTKPNGNEGVNNRNSNNFRYFGINYWIFMSEKEKNN